MPVSYLLKSNRGFVVFFFFYRVSCLGCGFQVLFFSSASLMILTFWGTDCSVAANIFFEVTGLAFLAAASRLITMSANSGNN